MEQLTTVTITSFYLYSKLFPILIRAQYLVYQHSYWNPEFIVVAIYKIYNTTCKYGNRPKAFQETSLPKILGFTFY